MKRFLVKVLLIVAALLIPLYIADHLLTKDYRSRDYYPFSTWTDLVDGQLNSDLWILGSSRALHQYNPKIFDNNLNVSCYNLGCNAQFLFLDLQCYEIAKAYNPKPKYILLDIAWPSLTMEEAPISLYFYMPYIYKRRFRRIIKDNKTISSAYLYIPCYRYLSEKASDISYKNDSSPEYKGYKAKYCNWIALEMNSVDSVKYSCEPKAVALLESFIQECKKDTIFVILIHSPMYYEGFEKIQNNDKMLNLFQNIANRNNVPFLDYTKDPICYDTMNFYNAMHLNAHGADLFSTKLAHDLDSLGLIPARK